MKLRRINEKRGNLLYQVIIHIILIGIIFGAFFIASIGKANSRMVKQQILEREVALLIDAAKPGMEIITDKENLNGVINRIRLENGKVYVDVEGLASVKGYPYFSQYAISLNSDENKFTISVR